MSPHAQHVTDDSHSYDTPAYDDEPEDSGEPFVSANIAQLAAGDRIGVAPPRKRGRRLLRWSFLLLLCLGGIWTVRDDTGTVPALTGAVKTALAPLLEKLAPPPAAPPAPLAAAAPPAPEPPPLPAAAEVGAASVPAAAVAVETPAAAPHADAAAGPAAVPARPDPLPPPVVDKDNPYQRRAAAAGLHPGISPAVLKTLTAADYRNAGVAIEKALRETSDTEILAWPKPAGAGLALFQVRFVQGSNADCRRYLVNVTKNGWSTTAPAMEKCGIRAPAAKAAGAE